MIKSALFTLFAFVSVAMMSFTTTAPKSATFDGLSPITLRAGTPVSLTLNQSLNADEAQIGNTVEFIVKNNVTVNGKVVIAAGSIAEGMVKDVEGTCKKCKKKDFCSKLEILVETAQAVDGQNVFLNSIPLIIKGDCCCGEPAKANIGTAVSARVRNDIKINA